MTTITKERLLTIKQWRETYGPGSNVVLPAEEAEELARIALASLEAEPVSQTYKLHELSGNYPDIPDSSVSAQGKGVTGGRIRIKPHVYRELVNRLHDTAIKCAGTQQLRERISRVLGDVITPDHHKQAEKSGLERCHLEAGNYPVTPGGWISCSERMPNDKQYVWCWGKSYGWTECDTFEGYYDWSRNKWWAVTDDGEEPASKVTHWMPLPEPPQESKSE